MARWTALIVYLIAGSVHALDGVSRWDALPAVAVDHLQGPYAGRNVCPMCAHGYDAGVLLFVPADSPVEQLGRIAGVLKQTTEALADARFRSFMVLTGGAPSPAVLDAVRGPEANWYVGQLPDAALADASAAFGVRLGQRGYAVVFAQRRLVWAFDPGANPAQWQASLANHAAYALAFLQDTYAEPVASTDPDTPRGRLWLAPDRLRSRVTLAEGASTRACFADAGNGPRAAALVALGAGDPTRDGSGGGRTHWARTDAGGCLTIEGFRHQERLAGELFSPLQQVATFAVSTSPLRAGGRSELLLASPAPPVTGREPVAGPCEGCEAVFQGLPGQLHATARLAPTGHPGEALRLSGTVFDGDGRPAPGIVVYAYQTDHTGAYPADSRLSGAAARHGRLRAWTRTDAAGRYAFLTIRPGAYADGTEPQHIHMHVVEPMRCTYYLGDVMFTDDPLLDERRRRQQRLAPGGSGIVQPHGNEALGWTVIRDVRLRLNVAGAEACADGSTAGGSH
jgi:protocatechuate 3,4-dioxygenase beta subunit